MGAPSLASLTATPGPAPSGSIGALPTVASLTSGPTALPTVAELTTKPGPPAPTPRVTDPAVIKATLQKVLSGELTTAQASAQLGVQLPHDGGLGGALGQVAHYAAKTGEGLAVDAYNFPGAILNPKHGLIANAAKSTKEAVSSGGAPNKSFTHTFVNPLVEGTAGSFVKSIEHPGAHPDQTLLNLLGVGSLAFRVGAGISAASDVARAGGSGADIAKALVTKPEATPRLIQARPTVEGEAPQMVPLLPSQNHMANALLGLHDKVIQKTLLENPNSTLDPRGLLPGSGKSFGLGGYAANKVGNSLEETARRDAAMAAAPAQRLASEGSKLGGRIRGAITGSRQEQQAALRLTAEQHLPDEAMATAHGQIQAIADNHAAITSGTLTPQELQTRAAALQGLGAVADHTQQIKLLQAVKDKGMVEQSPEGHIVVNAADHPKLARADARLAAAGQTQEGILGGLDRAKAEQSYIDHSGKVVTPKPDEVAAKVEQMAASRQARIDAPNRIHAGATFESRTPGKEGVPAPGLLRSRADVAQLQDLHDRLTAETQAAGEKAIGAEGMIGNKIAGEGPRQRSSAVVAEGTPPTIPTGGRVVSPSPGARAEVVGAALSKAKDKLERQEAAYQRRIKPTGIVGGEGARPGRQHVPYYSTEPNGAPAGVTRPVGAVVGQPAEAVRSGEFTGDSIKRGQVPDNTTGIVARHLNRLVKQFQTGKFREGLPGSGTRLTDRDMLVNTQELANAKVSDELKAALGGKKVTLDELAGEHQAFEAFRQLIVPKLAPDHAQDGLPHDAPIGTPAPAGYKWVDQKMMGPLGRPQIPLPGKVARVMDATNSGVTAATVYYKLGHNITRGFTDAATNLIEGSLRPAPMGRAYQVWKGLSEEERDQAIAGVGGGGFTAMPHEGDTKIGGAARVGAAFYARTFDAPSRFLNLHYIASKSGFGSPEKFSAFLRESKDATGLSDVQKATIDGIWKRANRASIQYDKLSDFERRYLNRVIWFWPWLKGSTKFAGRTIVEHPYQAAAVGTLGGKGADQTLKDLGPQASYNAGIFRIGGSDANPWTINLNTISPFSTPAGLMEDAIHVAHPTQAEQLASALSPALAAAGGAAYHLNQYGAASKGDVLTNLLGSLVGTTPEATLLKALTGSAAKPSRQFPTSRLEGIARFLGGSAVPRVQNRAIANSAYAKERTAAGRK